MRDMLQSNVLWQGSEASIVKAKREAVKVRLSNIFLTKCISLYMWAGISLAFPFYFCLRSLACYGLMLFSRLPLRNLSQPGILWKDLEKPMRPSLCTDWEECLDSRKWEGNWPWCGTASAAREAESWGWWGHWQNHHPHGNCWSCHWVPDDRLTAVWGPHCRGMLCRGCNEEVGPKPQETVNLGDK